MKLYITSNSPYPVAEDNIKYLLNVNTLTPEILQAHGYTEYLADNTIQFVETVPLTQEEKVELWVRRPRNVLLTASDWTQASDATVDKAAWAAYRQELRDLTTTYANVENQEDVVFPVKPT